MSNLPERFWAKVNKTDACWEWRASKYPTGYGAYNLDGKNVRPAHRVAYEDTNGPVPVGLVLDHLCRNRSCVNPAHLEPVTIGENVLRGVGVSALNAKKTHCPKGHEYAGDNLSVKSNGTRRCLACHREEASAYRSRKQHRLAA
jgi:hypothetical protein